MFVSKEAAMEMAQARHKVKTVRSGQGWLICPYVPGARYSSVHYVPDLKKSLQCEGEGNCHYHYLPAAAKAHVPCLVAKKPLTIPQAEKGGYEETMLFRGEHWSQRIVELTAGCFPAFNLDSKPDQLAVVYRAGPQRNGPLTFKWIASVLKGVPDSLAHFSVEDILPAVIQGAHRNAADVALDKSRPGRIEHKI